MSEDRSHAARYLHTPVSDIMLTKTQLGLETVKMPFVYCSAVTKRILLKMEKYLHKINFSKGILEKRIQRYQHLKRILRAVPMDTPTVIEVGKSSVQATLLDANHCPGAVMFLIEGEGKAILYTGDIRSEDWWVHSIVQNPVLLPYICGLKQIDCVYLDTTFATHHEPYRDFPSKAEGLQELLEKIRKYPPETVFYFRAWTLGYENVWLALSSFLRSRVHVSEYQLRLFRSDAGISDKETAALTGFQLGNDQRPGCLTENENVRIHSCEPGEPCHLALKKNMKLVWITPIISRLKDGSELREVGAGGGWRDLYPKTEVKLEDDTTFSQLLATISDDKIKLKLMEGLDMKHSLPIRSMSLSEPGNLKTEDDGTIKLAEFIKLLIGKEATQEVSVKKLESQKPPEHDTTLGDTIRFPYSRHSSYNELRHLISVLQPKDVCPCTVDQENWSEDVSVESLFGDLCSEQVFYYDQQIREELRHAMPPVRQTSKRKRDDDEDDTQKTESQNFGASSPVLITSPAAEPPEEEIKTGSPALPDNEQEDDTIVERAAHVSSCVQVDSQYSTISAFESSSQEGACLNAEQQELAAARTRGRVHAYMAAKRALSGNDTSEWEVLSRNDHTEQEIEL
jgi:DNA cross-link repair 1C protein